MHRSNSHGLASGFSRIFHVTTLFRPLWSASGDVVSFGHFVSRPNRLGASQFIQQRGTGQIPQSTRQRRPRHFTKSQRRINGSQQLSRILPSISSSQIQLSTRRTRHGRQLPRVHSTDGEIHRRVVTTLAIRAQLDPLFIEFVATDGRFGSLRQGDGTSFVGDLYSGGNAGLHHCRGWSR